MAAEGPARGAAEATRASPQAPRSLKLSTADNVTKHEVLRRKSLMGNGGVGSIGVQRAQSMEDVVAAAAAAHAASKASKQPREVAIGTLGTTLLICLLIFLNSLLMYHAAEGLWYVALHSAPTPPRPAAGRTRADGPRRPRPTGSLAS